MKAALLCLLLGGSGVKGADNPAATAWSDKDTRLATEYLNLLVEKPEYGRVLDLLWELYDKKQASGTLLDSIAAQAKGEAHPNVLLVHAHLLRKAGRNAEAETVYRKVLEKEASSYIALRALADLALERGEKEKAMGFIGQLIGALAADDAARTPLLVEKGRLAAEINQPAVAGEAWAEALRLRKSDAAFTREVAQLMVSAGLLDKALTIYRELAKTADPVARLDALYDLSRLEEQADHFDNAARALRDGLALAHFKDWRYEEFFRRLVKLHERYGQLDGLKAQLLKEAQAKPPQEKALLDMVRFADMVVDPDEHVKWLLELTNHFPVQTEYRWSLVKALMDRDAQPEAAKLLDEDLKKEGAGNASLVLLRCDVHLRSGEPEQAVERLKKLYTEQNANPEVEKAVYQFALAHSLDGVLETVLRARMAANRDKAEVVFELASFLMKRQRGNETKEIFERWYHIPAASQWEERQRRLRQISSFYVAAQDFEVGQQYARKALVNSTHSGRDDLLQLADAQAQAGVTEETLTLLERAWQHSDTPEKRTDVDERIFALLAGDTAPHPVAVAGNSNGEFRLPALFTGEGFGSDSPTADKGAVVSEAVHDYALMRVQEALPGQWSYPVPLLGAFLPWSWMEGPRLALAKSFPEVPPEQTLRAAWWCLRANETDLALVLIRQLIFDRTGHRVDASLEAEKLLLEIAQEDKNPLLIMRQIRRLAEIDPGNRITYQRRLAEQYIEISANPPPRTKAEEALSMDLREQATQILEQLLKEDPTNEIVLSALAQCYGVMHKRDTMVQLWENAVRHAKGNATSLLERYAEALMMQHRFKDFVETQMRLLEEETDLKKRREIFARALERLMWEDSLRGELAEDQKKTRLDLVANAVKTHSQRHPFDGFWFEAQARVYSKLGNNQKAFEAMKQAYYTAPDTPFSLDQLRAAALDAGDMKSAIYFQKQVAASASAKDEAGEWRSLVQLLEQDYRLGEADQVRRRLESRFSQDAASLEELAKYYQDTAQDEAARRVLEQIARVQSWQPAALLRLALMQERLGENAGAERTLRKLLGIAATAEKGAANVPEERQPWPLFETRGDKASKHGETLDAIAMDNTLGLDVGQRDKIRAFLSVPRAEASVIPDDPGPARLRAVEELARLNPKALDAHTMDELHLSDMERLWALFYSGRGAEFRALMSARLAEAPGLEAHFVYVWLAMRSHGVEDIAVWVRAGKTEDERKQRKEILHAAASVLANDSQFEFTDTDLKALGDTHILSNVDLVGLARRLKERQRYHQAMLLGDAAKRNAPSLEAEYGVFLSKIAEADGDVASERRYLQDVWAAPLQPERPTAFDPFLHSFSNLLEMAATPQEREKLIAESWKRIENVAPSSQGELRKARLQAIAGAQDLGARKLADFLGNGFLASRAFVEPLLGRLPAGVQSPGPRIDELNHLRGYWDDLREWNDVLQQDGLTPLLPYVQGKVNARNGGVPQGPRANIEYSTWRNQLLVRRMRAAASFPERLRLLREHLAGDDSVENLSELGKFLESQGLLRECIEVYRQLPERAPSNTEYCQQLLTVCEQAWDYEPVMDYIAKLLVAEPQFRPQNIPENLVEEKQAAFLAHMHQTEKLRALAFRSVAAAKTNRVPEVVPYLRELAPLLEREGDKAGAAAAWDQLTTVWPQDVDAALHRAQLLESQGQHDKALECLRQMPLTNLWNESVQKGLVLRVKLVADAGLWDEVRVLMNLVADGDRKPGTAPEVNVPGVIAVSKVLAEHQRTADAQSLLVRAERSVKEDGSRFQLRLEELKLASQEPAWDPRRDMVRIAALLRTPIASEPALKTLAEWMASEAKTARSNVWLEILKTATPGPNAAIALAALGRAGEVDAAHFAAVPWGGDSPVMGVPQRLAVRLLLEHHQTSLARSLISQDDPLLVPVLVQQGDEMSLRELFSRLIRQSFPGGVDTVDYAEALVKEGHANLAEELYALAVERSRATGTVLMPLVKSYARFLIGQRRFEQAENLLLRDGMGLTDGMPEILSDLYHSWNKLDRIDAELVKFHLPAGVREETRFLARKAAAAK